MLFNKKIRLNYARILSTATLCVIFWNKKINGIEYPNAHGNANIQLGGSMHACDLDICKAFRRPSCTSIERDLILKSESNVSIIYRHKIF